MPSACAHIDCVPTSLRPPPRLAPSLALCDTLLPGSAPSKQVVADPSEKRPLVEVVVGGPLCESGDIFTQEEGGFVSKRSLPAAAVGELLIIGCAVRVRS